MRAELDISVRSADLFSSSISGKIIKKTPEKIRAGNQPGQKGSGAKRFLGIHRNCKESQFPAVQRKIRGRKNECVACLNKEATERRKREKIDKKSNKKRKPSDAVKGPIKRTRSSATSAAGE